MGTSCGELYVQRVLNGTMVAVVAAWLACLVVQWPPNFARKDHCTLAHAGFSYACFATMRISFIQRREWPLWPFVVVIADLYWQVRATR